MRANIARKEAAAGLYADTVSLSSPFSFDANYFYFHV